MIRVEVRMIRAGQLARELLGKNTKTGRNLTISGTLDGFRGGEGGEKQDPQVTHRIHGSKSTNLHQNQQIRKKNWGYFWWGFSDLGRNQQNQARKQRVGAPNVKDRPLGFRPTSSWYHEPR